MSRRRRFRSPPTSLSLLKNDYKSIWASQKIVSSDCVLMANKRVMVSSQPALLNTKSRNGQYRLRVDQAQCNDHLADYKSIWASQKIVSSDCVLMANKRGMISSQPALLQIQKAEMDSTDCVLIRHNATTI